ncbi:MAG TPA: DUF5398 family protein [Waddliaceae bacterium]
MFGLEDQKKKKKGAGFVFELEKELNDRRKSKEIQQRIEKRVQEIKAILHEGENKKEFERLGLILHGYTSLQKVMSRFATK